jgi:formylglycine-generating enzyme required for sulfatase activity
MVFVPAGTFVMGAQNSPTYKANADGSVSSTNGDTRHPVTLSAYCMSKFHVTNAQYKAFCDDAGASFLPSGPSTGSRCYWDNPEFDWTTKANHPVLWVGYNSAVAYANWVASKTGWAVSLPSEAQWERAARGQTVTGSENLYPWGNGTTVNDYMTVLDDLVLSAVKAGTPRTVNGNSYPYWPFIVTASNNVSDVSNYAAIAHGTDDANSADIDESSAEVQGVWSTLLRGGGYTTAVGRYPASAAGCYDMAGNAYQFTRDYFTISYYISLAAKGPDPVVDDVAVLTQPDEKSGSDGSIGNANGQPTKIIRGGSWYAHEISAASHRRTETRAPGLAGYHSVGFRIVAVPKLAGTDHGAERPPGRKPRP